MIYGIGIDLVEISRIEGVILRWGDRFIRRVFTPGEAKICVSRAFSYSAFALRFAAKEAFSKALGTGMRNDLKWRDIEVANDPNGKPDLRLHGKSSEICRRKGVKAIHLSLSDEGEYGTAMVILEKSEDCL